ncbi:hypothetical protein CapIbe_012808 [Capra ibex]
MLLSCVLASIIYEKLATPLKGGEKAERRARTAGRAPPCGEVGTVHEGATAAVGSRRRPGSHVSQTCPGSLGFDGCSRPSQRPVSSPNDGMGLMSALGFSRDGRIGDLSLLPQFGRGEETDKPNREAEGASELRRPAARREHVDRSSSKGRPRGVLSHFPSLTPTIGWPKARLESSFNAHKYSPEGVATALLNQLSRLPLTAPLVSTCVSSDNSFSCVRQEPSFGPWKGSPFL